jgi:hypothetical protein
VLACFAVTLFLSATLLFFIQPMFTRMVLPLFGGSPAVWTTAMMFFQGALLAGYAYAHVTSRRLSLRSQVAVHLGLLLVALFTLPIAVDADWQPRPDLPIASLLAVLAVSLGLPFFALAANAPMLQRWFALTGHRDSHNPYFLYASSNLGSILALLAYPLVVEPLLRIHEQAFSWAAGYGGLFVMVAACAAWLRGRPAGAAVPGVATGEGGTPTRPVAAPVTARRRLHWLLLSFAPSSLLLGVTAHLTHSIGSAPLLWVLPLALYLLTFVICFSRRPPLRHALVLRLQPVVLLPLVMTEFVGRWSAPGVLFAAHLAAFFWAALVCHGELAARRPAVEHLTEFYLWLSVGGLLGGVFNALVAPVVFDSLLEYPLAIVLAAALRPASAGGRPVWADLALPALLFGLLAGSIQVAGGEAKALGAWGLRALALVAAVGFFAFVSRPLRFGLGIGAILWAGAIWGGGDATTLARERGFFGVLEVEREPGGFHVLRHSGINHGVQSLHPESRREPLTYYRRAGPLGQVMERLGPSLEGARIAAVGLGPGSVACYATAGQEWTLYEIDPDVVRIARDPRYFTFLEECAPDAAVALGDARLMLAQVPDAHYRVIILDAFSSASVPIHLLTREALELYFDKLEDGGVLVFHITNRHVKLASVLGNLAESLGLEARARLDTGLDAEARARHEAASHWVVMSREREDLAALTSDERWQPVRPERTVGVWTDDFSNLFRALQLGKGSRDEAPPSEARISANREAGGGAGVRP